LIHVASFRSRLANLVQRGKGSRVRRLVPDGLRALCEAIA
jgi:hypothetical protein